MEESRTGGKEGRFINAGDGYGPLGDCCDDSQYDLQGRLIHLQSFTLRWVERRNRGRMVISMQRK